MLIDELKKCLADRFEGFELVELLDISVEEVIDSFSEKIAEESEYLEEFMKNGH